MKLSELLEYDVPIPQRRQRKGRLPSFYANTQGDYEEDLVEPHEVEYVRKQNKLLKRNPKVKLHGSGAFSSVYGHEDRPHDVRKVSDIFYQGQADGFYHYAKAILKSDDYANPYFPKFRSFREYENDKDQMMYSVQLERLFPLGSLNYEQIQAIAQKTFGTAKGYAGGEDLTNAATAVLRGKESIQRVGPEIDPDLLQAAELIRKVAKRAGKFIDLHSYNAMARLTPYGPQLVITDPIAGS